MQGRQLHELRDHARAGRRRQIDGRGQQGKNDQQEDHQSYNDRDLGGPR